MTTNNLLTIVILFAWLCILLPSIIYLFTSWQIRKEKLFARLDDETIKLYYKQFYPNEKINNSVSGEDLKSHFEKHFTHLYGRKHYIIPLTILGILSCIGFVATLLSVESWLDKSQSTANFSPIAISAFLGAYAWVLGDQFSRYQRSDFTYHDVYNSIYRFLVAIPLGLSLSEFVKDAVTVPFVFLLAAFPIETLLKFSRRLVSQKLGLGENDSENGQLELQKLQGMGLHNAERYQKEGIFTIAELAWADPIDLMIKTNKEFSFVIDSISQALLWIYFDNQTELLYKYSLRGSQEVSYFLHDLNSEIQEVKEAAEKTLDACAGVLSMTPESFFLSLCQIRDDPYNEFLYKIWG